MTTLPKSVLIVLAILVMLPVSTMFAETFAEVNSLIWAKPTDDKTFIPKKTTRYFTNTFIQIFFLVVFRLKIAQTSRARGQPEKNLS
jgi:ABC-type Fe3+ transport system permease subunit